MEPRTPRNAKNLPNKNSITNGRIAEGGWAAVIPPRGVTIRRPTVGVRSVLDPENYLNAKSQSSSLEVLAPDASDPSLFLSPGAPRHRKPGPKKRKSLVFSIIFDFFGF